MPKKTLNAYVLLDRSASMQSRWGEALSSVNAFVDELEKGTRVTVACFDDLAGLQFDILRQPTKGKRWKPITSQDAVPRGSTPLYDAVGRLVALAEEADPEKAILILMSDGEENCSVELSKDGARDALDRCRKRGWQVVQLGMDFEKITAQAASIGTHSAQTLSMSSGSYTRATQTLAKKAKAYAATGQTVAFDDEDRKAAS